MWTRHFLRNTRKVIKSAANNKWWAKASKQRNDACNAYNAKKLRSILQETKWKFRPKISNTRWWTVQLEKMWVDKFSTLILWVKIFAELISQYEYEYNNKIVTSILPKRKSLLISISPLLLVSFFPSLFYLTCVHYWDGKCVECEKAALSKHFELKNA